MGRLPGFACSQFLGLVEMNVHVLEFWHEREYHFMRISCVCMQAYLLARGGIIRIRAKSRDQYHTGNRLHFGTD